MPRPASRFLPRVPGAAPGGGLASTTGRKCVPRWNDVEARRTRAAAGAAAGDGGGAPVKNLGHAVRRQPKFGAAEPGTKFRPHVLAVPSSGLRGSLSLGTH